MRRSSLLVAFSLSRVCVVVLLAVRCAAPVSQHQRSLCVVWTPRRPDVCCFSTLRVASPLSSTRSPRSAAASQRSQTRDPTHTTHAATTPPSSLLPPFRHELASLRRLLWPLAAAAVALAVQRSADAVVASLFAGAVCGQSVVHTQGVHGQSEGEENSHGNASVKEEGTKHTSDSERRERKWSAAGRDICRSRRAAPCRAGLSPHSVPVSYTARHTRQQLATHNSAHSLTASAVLPRSSCVWHDGRRRGTSQTRAPLPRLSPSSSTSMTSPTVSTLESSSPDEPDTPMTISSCCPVSH